MGLANYYAPYVRDFATLAGPITDLLTQARAFVWGPEQQSAFDAIKAALTSAPCLLLPDPERPFIIETNASTTGLGAVLVQDHCVGE